MKVLLVANHLNPGGIATYCLALGRHVRGPGLEILVASGGGSLEGEAARLGIRHFRVPLDTSSEANPMLLGALGHLGRIVREENINVLHDQTRVAQVVTHVLGRRFGIPRVSTCHGFFKRRFLRKLFPLWGDRVIAISPAVKTHLLRDWGLGESRVRLVPHGLPDADPGPGRSLRPAWGVGEGELVVGALGRLSPVKGYDVLLRALALLRADLPALRGVFIGDGPEAGRLQALVRSLGLGGRVRFAAPTADPGDFFASVDLFCAPSREEGFGLAILDAMRHGRPVVASRVGGIPDVVRDAETGVLVPAEDPAALAEAIRRVALDARLRARLGAAARKRASEDFSVGRMAESTRRVYEELAP